MPLLNCKVELKIKWAKNCVLYAASNENDINNYSNANNITFTIKDKKTICSCCTFISKRQPKTTKIVSKGFERSVY